MFIATWYNGAPVVTVAMGGGDRIDELCITMLVVELLRDFIDRPLPTLFKEGSPELETYVDFAYRRCKRGLEFGLTPEQDNSIKNLAFNYYIDGISGVINQPSMQHRLWKCWRGMYDKKH